MSKRRLSKEELETDVLVTLYARTSVFFKQNTTAIIGATVAVLILIGSLVGYFLHSTNQENAAQAFLGHAEQYFNAGEYDTALNGSDAVLGIGLAAIVNNYGRTEAGNLARFYAAVSEKELGNSASALTYMQRFNPPKGILGVSPISFHAVLLDNNGKHLEAARMFRKAANWDNNARTTPHNLLRAAQSAMSANDYRLASELAEEIIKNYSNSPESAHALRIAGMVAAR
jgi:tetratricopeptide (TPR) repeat protein